MLDMYEAALIMQRIDQVYKHVMESYEIYY